MGLITFSIHIVPVWRARFSFKITSRYQQLTTRDIPLWIQFIEIAYTRDPVKLCSDFAALRGNIRQLRRVDGTTLRRKPVGSWCPRMQFRCPNRASSDRRRTLCCRVYRAYDHVYRAPTPAGRAAQLHEPEGPEKWWPQ